MFKKESLGESGKDWKSHGELEKVEENSGKVEERLG